MPSLSPTQVKLALQSGATFMADAGLTGGGAGSVNLWSSRVITTNGLTSLLNSVTGALGLTATAQASGASFWDSGSLTGHLYQHTGIRLLSLLDLLNAERSDRATELAYRQSLAAYLTSLEQLRQAVGTRSLP